MITEEHLQHWLREIQWQLNGLHSELSKKGYQECNGMMLHGSFLSLEYLREKSEKIDRLKGQIEWDMVHD